jgi:hypothetical protein
MVCFTSSIGAIVALLLNHVTSSQAAPLATNPWNDTHLVSMFDGKTLDGWTDSDTGGWTVVNSTLHSTGNARGYLYYNKQQVGDFRWIFNVRRYAITGAAHDPTVLIWGTTDPIRDALSAIQFQPPNSYHWDYRPGQNDAGNSEFTVVKHSRFDITKWAQCEIVATKSTGVARMACCELPGTATSCNGTEIIDFKNATAGVVGPLALQVHNAGIQDEYKGLYVESPVITKPGQFITITV